jgi:hypothetical protein
MLLLLLLPVNYLSHFLLTEKLIPLLKKSTKPKILQISSSYHWTVDGADLRPSSSSNNDSSTPVACQIGGNHGFVFFRGIRQYANSKLAQILHARALKRRYKEIDVVIACPAWVGTQIAGQKGSLVHTGFLQLAFPVEGHGINSFLYAIFDDTAEKDDDYYVNTTVTNPNLFDQLPAWMSHVLPIRDCLGSVVAFSLLAFQRMVPAVKRKNPSSRVSYDKELQESLYEWSKKAVSEYL